ncbi:hypothetical protein MTR_4g091295 [Medicago truncatula]|uniref:Uncharacterized protein n=1 Tax=Medicago truncatula TaxID=3880 RepID=A0A072UMX0_MEDTR|nr:hypothetical protein MTR_4g091295 [Medicago truncatula]
MAAKQNYKARYKWKLQTYNRTDSVMKLPARGLFIHVSREKLMLIYRICVNYYKAVSKYTKRGKNYLQSEGRELENGGALVWLVGCNCVKGNWEF